MSKTTTIRKDLVSLLTEKFGVPLDEACNGGTTMDELGLDSLALVELLLDLQKNLYVSIEQGEILPNHTVDETVVLIARHKASA